MLILLIIITVQRVYDDEYILHIMCKIRGRAQMIEIKIFKIYNWKCALVVRHLVRIHFEIRFNKNGTLFCQLKFVRDICGICAALSFHFDIVTLWMLCTLDEFNDFPFNFDILLHSALLKPHLIPIEYFDKWTGSGFTQTPTPFSILLKPFKQIFSLHEFH